MSAPKLASVPQEQPAETDEDLLGKLASELDCNADADSIAERITELVTFEERVKEAADGEEDLDSIVERLEAGGGAHVNTIALEALQAALDLSDVDVRIIGQHSIPEFAAKQRLAQRPEAGGRLRVLLQTTIKSLAARAQ